MRHALAALALASAATALLAPAAAHADGASFLAQFGVSNASVRGGLGDEMSATNVPAISLGVGFRSRHVGLLAVGDMTGFTAADPLLDGPSLLSFAGGVEIAGYGGIGGKWELVVRGGKKWRWMGNSAEVMRSCHQTGTCAGGFWLEEPSYTSEGLSVAVGVQRTFSDKNLAAALGLELRVEQVNMELPGRGTVDGAILLFGVNVLIGTGGYRR